MMRGAIAFQIDFTFSNDTGFRLWGIVDDPTCSAANDSATSLISVRWRWRMSSAMFAITPSAVMQACARSVHGSGSTIWVDIDRGSRPSDFRKRFSSARGLVDARRPIALYAPTAPESLPGRRRATAERACVRSPSRDTYDATANPKVTG